MRKGGGSQGSAHYVQPRKSGAREGGTILRRAERAGGRCFTKIVAPDLGAGFACVVTKWSQAIRGGALSLLEKEKIRSCRAFRTDAGPRRRVDVNPQKEELLAKLARKKERESPK